MPIVVFLRPLGLRPDASLVRVEVRGGDIGQSSGKVGGDDIGQILSDSVLFSGEVGRGESGQTTGDGRPILSDDVLLSDEVGRGGLRLRCNLRGLPIEPFLL